MELQPFRELIGTPHSVSHEGEEIKPVLNNRRKGCIVVPQKNAYEVAQRVGILVSTLTVASIKNQLLYA